MLAGYVLDEHLRGSLWQAIQSHNARGSDLIDVVRVGDRPDLPLGSQDPDILIWAEREGRILVSMEEATMKTHFANHLAAGHRSPGLFLIRKNSTRQEIVDFLAAAAHASDPHDWENLYKYIP
jgi:hypothetical protein